MKHIWIFALPILVLFSCQPEEEKSNGTTLVASMDMASKVKEYKEVTLTSDLSTFNENQKALLKKMIAAAKIMDELFWKQAYGDKETLLSQISDPNLATYVKMNYGPWDRLDGDAPFIETVGEKPLGAQFYPLDMSKEEFEAYPNPEKTSLYTVIRRDDSGGLMYVPYHIEYRDELDKASQLLKEAAELAEDPGFKNYLQLRSEALVTSQYQESDYAWMDMKDNQFDLVIGPIENYEDKLFNYKAAFEAYVLIKDIAWSERLAKYSTFLPELQEGLPVEEAYKQETPGTDSDLNAYDVVYYAGDCNAGGKTIAINLPNDEEIQLNKGTRRLQLKNAMKAKYDEILVPIADVLIDESQRKHITFDAFFANTMFHEVAHGLGIKNTIDGKGTVREALKEKGSAIEEGKADILGLYMVTKLAEKGELGEVDLMDYYTTFLAGIFRSSRFGSSSAHGRANMIRFNYFKEKNAFSYDNESGTYKVNFEDFQAAMESLSRDLLTLQGDGDYEGVNAMFEQYGFVGEDLSSDFEKINAMGIPKDIVFNQGEEVLGL